MKWHFFTDNNFQKGNKGTHFGYLLSCKLYNIKVFQNIIVISQPSVQSRGFGYSIRYTIHFKAKFWFLLKTACSRQSIYPGRKESLVSRIAFMCENQCSHGQCSHNSYRDCTDVLVTALTITHFVFQIVCCYNSGWSNELSKPFWLIIVSCLILFYCYNLSPPLYSKIKIFVLKMVSSSIKCSNF